MPFTGLFHEGVVVTEADGDSKFYEAIGNCLTGNAILAIMIFNLAFGWERSAANDSQRTKGTQRSCKGRCGFRCL